MIILGIDPGTAITGWGTIKSGKKIIKGKSDGYYCLKYGCIKTPVDMRMSHRLLLLRKELLKIIDQFKPDCLVIEQLFFGINAKTAMTVGQARGVILMTAAEKGLDLYEYQGLKVKLIVTGYGRSDKKQIQSAVKKILKLKEIPKPDDAADALAVALCHIIFKTAPEK